VTVWGWIILALGNVKTQICGGKFGRLLEELCVKLGFCLPPSEGRRLEQLPPGDVDGFTDAVIEAEGQSARSPQRQRNAVRGSAAGDPAP
jgi:hypothetical protein